MKIPMSCIRQLYSFGNVASLAGPACFEKKERINTFGISYMLIRHCTPKSFSRPSQISNCPLCSPTGQTLWARTSDVWKQSRHAFHLHGHSVRRKPQRILQTWRLQILQKIPSLSSRHDRQWIVCHVSSISQIIHLCYSHFHCFRTHGRNLSRAIFPTSFGLLWKTKSQSSVWLHTVFCWCEYWPWTSNGWWDSSTELSYTISHYLNWSCHVIEFIGGETHLPIVPVQWEKKN